MVLSTCKNKRFLQQRLKDNFRLLSPEHVEPEFSLSVDHALQNGVSTFVNDPDANFGIANIKRLDDRRKKIMGCRRNTGDADQPGAALPNLASGQQGLVEIAYDGLNL